MRQTVRCGANASAVRVSLVKRMGRVFTGVEMALRQGFIYCDSRGQNARTVKRGTCPIHALYWRSR